MLLLVIIVNGLDEEDKLENEIKEELYVFV